MSKQEKAETMLQLGRALGQAENLAARQALEARAIAAEQAAADALARLAAPPPAPAPPPPGPVVPPPAPAPLRPPANAREAFQRVIDRYNAAGAKRR
jgi:hypothetical protein